MSEYLLIFDFYGNAFVKTDVRGKDPQVVEVRVEKRYFDNTALNRIFANIKFHRELIEQFARENDVGCGALMDDLENIENPICVAKYDTDIEVDDDDLESEFPSCKDNCKDCDWADWCYLSDKDHCVLCQERHCDKTGFCKFD